MWANWSLLNLLMVKLTTLLILPIVFIDSRQNVIKLSTLLNLHAVQFAHSNWPQCSICLWLNWFVLNLLVDKLSIDQFDCGKLSNVLNLPTFLGSQNNFGKLSNLLTGILSKLLKMYGVQIPIITIYLCVILTIYLKWWGIKHSFFPLGLIIHRLLFTYLP